MSYVFDHGKNTDPLFSQPVGITSSIQFVSHETVSTEREGERVDVCVELFLFNNETVLTHEISFYIVVGVGTASKSY